MDMLKRFVALLAAAVLALSLAGCGTSGEQSNGSSQNSNSSATSTQQSAVQYTFKSNSKLQEHYEKHGIDMGFASAEEYEQAASDVINNPDALHKTEAEDGDDVYYLESTNEFVILGTNGYIRTYFCPEDGKAYYDRQ